MKKFKDFINKTWTIAIGSTVIATLILWGIDKLFNTRILNTLTSIFCYKLSLTVWLIALLIVSATLMGLLIYRFLIIGNTYHYYTKIGNYRYKELYDILNSHNLPIVNNLMQWSHKEPPKESVLVQFATYISLINTGITAGSHVDQDGYLYGILCPYLLSFGLVTQTELESTRDFTLYSYRTSENGFKFYSYLQKAMIRK